MKRLHKTDIISNFVEILEEDDGLFHPNALITTEQFVTMMIQSCKGNIAPTRDNWSSGYIDYALHKGIIEDYDMTNIRNPVERRSAARIVHEVIVTEMKERDEDDWSAAENLKDLYSCHTCVMHIAQIYVKGIMHGSDNNIFDVQGSITGEEAAAVVVRMLDKEQRIQTEGRKFMITVLSPDEVWELMENNSMVKLVDVRTNEEYKTGHIERSICIPLINIANNPFSICENRDVPIILYCQKGYKSSVAAHALMEAGYSKLFTIPGIELYPYNLTV